MEHIESASLMDISDEDGVVLCQAIGISPESLGAGASMSFTETPNYCSTVEETVGMVTVEGQVTTNTDNLFLFEVPDMDSEQLQKAEDKIRKKTQEFPEYAVLFRGSGAKAMQSRFKFLLALMHHAAHGLMRLFR